MRTINLVAVTLESFRSFRKSTRIEFTRTPGFKFMTGLNLAEPSLGANGAGKTTTWEGVTWINYGTSIKDQRSSDLTTWGEKKPRGKCEWYIDGVLATVERSGNPNYLALNGEPVTQEDIDRLLGRTKKQFVQSVIYGQGAKLFIDLAIPERAAIMDDVLDLGLWLNLADTAGKQISGVEKQVNDLNHQIAYDDGRLASLPDESELIRQRDQWQENKTTELDRMIREVEEAEAAIVELIETASRLESRANQHDDISDLEKTLRTTKQKLSRLDQDTGGVLMQISATQKTLDFFTSSPELCPTCTQRITKTFSRDIVRDEKANMEELVNLNRKNAAITSNLIQLRDETEADLSKKSRIHEHLAAQVREAQTKIDHKGVLIHRMASEIDRFGNSKNPWTERIEQAREDRAKIVEHRTTLIHDRQTLEAGVLLDSFWRDGFKRVRLFEINRILTHLELEIENAANMLGLFDWRISVTTQTENKSGGLRHGVQIQITSPDASAPWESWSGGEGQRIRLAVAMGFSGLIERMTATRFGIEIYDEPSSFLSPEGIDDFLSCLRARVDNERKSVWLIDCGVMVNTGFDEVWQMTKTHEGSKLSLIASDE